MLLFFMHLPVFAAQAPLSDEAINDAVEDELALDAWLSRAKIDVLTQDGIVTLDGTVDSVLVKDRAAKIAEMVRGVRSVINHIKVSPAGTYSDGDILKQVQQALRDDPAADEMEIDVEVTEGIVLLSGKADSHAERSLAEQVAKGVRGVKGVTNEIRLEVPFVSQRPDSEIRKDIQERLRWDVLVDHAKIEVEVEKGNVVLSGMVGSAAEKTRTISDAWVAGVNEIDASGLQVVKWQRDETLRSDKYAVKTDEEIEKAVEDTLSYDPRIAPFKGEIYVRSGVVTLRGEVDSLKAKRAASRDVLNTVGVVSVNNRLKVVPGKEVSKDELVEKVKAALKRSPQVNLYDVDVANRNGVITLSGKVDSHTERAEADDLVSRVEGVLMVVNRIMVRDNKPLVYNPYLDDWYVYGYSDYEERRTLKSDDQIKQSVKRELWWSPYVDSDNIKVTVEKGVVTLTGEVGSWPEYQIAAENAFQAGARWVYNLLACETCVEAPSKSYPFERWMR
jgi:osmotically-inducible protein OsmY